MRQATVGRAFSRALVGAVLAGMVLYLCNLVAVTVVAPSAQGAAAALVAPWAGLVVVAGAVLGYPLDFTLALHAGLAGLGLVTAALFLAFLLAGLWRQGRRFAVAGGLLLLLIIQLPLRTATQLARQRAACQVAVDTAFFARQPSAAATRQAHAICAPLAGKLDATAQARMDALDALQRFSSGDEADGTQRLAALLQPQADPVSLRRNLQSLLDHGQNGVVARFTDAYVQHFSPMDSLPKRRAFYRLAIAAHAHLGEWAAAQADLAALDRDVDAATTHADLRAAFLAEDARMRADLGLHRVPKGL